MGLLVDGVWQDEQHEVRTKDGRFVRPTTRYRNWITADGSAGPTRCVRSAAVMEGRAVTRVPRSHEYLYRAA